MARILIVDDDADIRHMMRLMLEHAGHAVEEAADGAAGLAAARCHRPDVVVTDLEMPVMDGRELIVQLRSDPRTASIPIMAVSAGEQSRLSVQVSVRKPFDAGILLSALAQVQA